MSIDWAKKLLSGGIPSWAYAAGAASIACLVLWLLWSRAEMKAEANEAHGAAAILRGVNAAQNATIGELQDVIRHRDKAAEEHKATIDGLKKRSSARDEALQRAAQDDEEVASWLGARLPAPVADSLRQ